MITARPSELRRYSTQIHTHFGTEKSWSNKAEPTRKSDKIRIGLLVPFSGKDAIWGPSGQYSAILASALVNASGGILGREIELFGADSGGNPQQVVERVGQLVNHHEVDALVGVHMSNVRIAVRDAFARHIPYVYATQYEGGENAPGLFAIGETPLEQYGDAIRFMIEEQGTKKWFLLGNDYVWPRETNKIISRLLHELGAEIVGEHYVPLGQKSQHNIISDIEKSGADIVFQSLVGTDCVTFNQQFGASGLAEKIIRLSGVIEENVLMGIEAENAQNLFGVAGYFNSLKTHENQAFLSEYESAFGDYAPIQGGMSQACYESIFFLAALAQKTGSINRDEMIKQFEHFEYHGARGPIAFDDGAGRMDCHLMRADGLDYEHIRTFPA